jgi:hypothetical protein
MIVILLIPMPIMDKLGLYLQLLLMVVVYILIITEQLPYHVEISFIELLVRDVFKIIIMITFSTLFIQLFLDKSTKK